MMMARAKLTIRIQVQVVRAVMVERTPKAGAQCDGSGNGV